MTPTQQQLPPEQAPTEPVWGAPQPAQPKPWSTKKTVAAVGVAAVIAAGGGAAIYAATSGTSNATAGRGGMGGPGGHSMMGAAMDSLHSESVVADAKGGYTTELTQTGKITDISTTSVTAESTDKYSHTYTITQATAAHSLKVGDTATIHATVENGTATVTQIAEGSARGAMPFGNGPMGGQPPGGPGN